MKKLIAALILFPSLCLAAAGDYGIDRRNVTNNNWEKVLLLSPATSGILGYDPVTKLSTWLTLGPNVQILGGVLSSTVPAQTWSSITGKPTLFSGAYADLTGKPALFDGAYSSLSGLPTLFSGAYGDLTGKPTLFSGAYADLSGKPTIPAAQVNADWNSVSGLSQILNKPTLATVATSGSYNDLTGKPTIPAAQVNADWNAVSGVAQILNKPTLNSGTVTSVTAGTGLSGGVITTTGTISLPNTGTAGTYANVTTDAQGRVTGGTSVSINDNPGRTLVTSATATGFQISATRIASVCYEGSFSTTSTIGGPSSASVFLETADTNSTTASDWTIRATQVYSNNITLAIVLNQVQGNNWSMCRYIPAGKFVRIRSGSIAGTASASINTQQQEVLQ